ncbi:MAG TPA: sigma-70 family RNA polymerase sigma factor [Iamia sp.]|nr:sigma-70 family RNA polymerase sigma factor [Iamia sp.]
MERTTDLAAAPWAATTPADEDALLRPLLPGLFAFATAVAGDRRQAEDLVIEATARTLPHLRRGRVDDVELYLRRAIVNELTSWGRRRQLERRQAHHGRAVAARDEPGGPGGVDDRLLCAALLRRLPVRQRAVLALRFLEDRSVEEVADLMGTTTGTVKTQTSRGLDRLRVLMEGHDG